MERLLELMQASFDSRTGRPRTARRHEDRLVGASLLRRRAWFADPPPADNQGDDSGDDGGEGDGGKSKPTTVPYGKFSDTRKQLRDAKKQAEELQTRLQKFEEAEAAAERKKAEAEGRHSDIIAQLEPKAKRADELEATLKGYLDAELQTVPEEFRDLIPDGDIAAQLKWVQAARAKGLFKTGRQAPGLDSGQTGDRPSGDLSAKEMAMMKRFKLTREQVLAAKARLGR